MPIPDYTLVVGVDAKHLKQLAMVWPTWRKHKPSLLAHPMIVFYDTLQVNDRSVQAIVDHPNLRIIPWEPKLGIYDPKPGVEIDKWNNPQRYKMLAGFVYVPGNRVQTPYWLKIDTDVVATEYDDWIDGRWFNDYPAIISHPWGFTRPADQILRLDRWAQSHRITLRFSTGPLNLVPEPGATRVHHKRIISWCGFFNTKFTHHAASAAAMTTGNCLLPEPSQDGYLWYMATRQELPIVTTSMKRRGWQHWSNDHNVREHAKEAMECSSS